MSFQKIKTNGWVTNEKLLHTQLNQLDTDHAKAIDKTGETVALGGGVTGEIEFLSGSSIVVDTGASVTLKPSSSMTLNSAASIALQSGSSIVAASSSTLNAQSNSTILLDGYVQLQNRTISSNYSIDSSGSDNILLVNTSSARTLTLPSPTAGRFLTIQDSTGNSTINKITVSPHSTENINGANTSVTLSSNFTSWNFVSDGINWFYSVPYKLVNRAYINNAFTTTPTVGVNATVFAATLQVNKSGIFFATVNLNVLGLTAGANVTATVNTTTQSGAFTLSNATAFGPSTTGSAFISNAAAGITGFTSTIQQATLGPGNVATGSTTFYSTYAGTIHNAAGITTETPFTFGNYVLLTVNLLVSSGASGIINGGLSLVEQ